MFQYFISLGCNCKVASSLGKYGLRAASGPFDWCISYSLKGVVEAIESKFSDFMAREYVEEDPQDILAFMNSKYDINFPHDIKCNFEKERYDITEKYRRRIEKFEQMIRQPTCFIRTILNEEEVDYVNANHNAIVKILKRSNSQNDIIYIFPEQTWNLNVEAVSFSSSKYWKRELRDAMDDPPELIEYLISHYDKRGMDANMLHDIKRENARLYLTEKRYNLLNKISLIKDDVALPDEIIIYAMGNVGQAFYDKIRGKCNIKCFMNRSADRMTYDGIPVYTPKRLTKIEGNPTIIVTATYDFENIVKIIDFYAGEKRYDVKSLEEYLPEPDVSRPRADRMS